MFDGFESRPDFVGLQQIKNHLRSRIRAHVRMKWVLGHQFVYYSYEYKHSLVYPLTQPGSMLYKERTNLFPNVREAEVSSCHFQSAPVLKSPLISTWARQNLRFDLSHMSELLLGVLGGDGRRHNDIIARSKRTTSAHAPKET